MTLEMLGLVIAGLAVALVLVAPLIAIGTSSSRLRRGGYWANILAYFLLAAAASVAMAFAVYSIEPEIVELFERAGHGGDFDPRVFEQLDQSIFLVVAGYAAFMLSLQVWGYSFLARRTIDSGASRWLTLIPWAVGVVSLVFAPLGIVNLIWMIVFGVVPTSEPT